MQIFILDYGPKAVPKLMANCHVVKLCLETAQILTGVWKNQGNLKQDWMIGIDNPKHPVIATITNKEQIRWTIIYYKYLLLEFELRYGHKHTYWQLAERYAEVFKVDISKEDEFDKEKLTFARGFKDFNTKIEDLVLAYRRYYWHKKVIIKNWKYYVREEPKWLNRTRWPKNLDV